MDEKRRIIITVLITVFVISAIILIPHMHTDSEKDKEELTTVEIVSTTENVSEIEPESITEHYINDYTGVWFSGMQLTKNTPYQITDNHITKENALVYFRNHKETWYSVVQPHGYTTTYDIPGKHVADDGTIRDKDGYVCIASHDLPKGYTLLTSVGPGKVYDEWDSTMTIGIYTDWR